MALELLTVAHKIYCDHGEPHLAGRALISRGIYEGYAGDRERGIQSISEGLRQIDKKRDPRLAFLAVHNLAFLLVEGKRFREARVLSRKILWHSGLTPRRIDRIKLLWIEGRANLGLGRLDRAARDFQAVRTEFLELEMHYQAALAALDLALVDLLQNRTTEARATVLEAVEVFCALEISQEQLNAVNILKEAFKRDVMAAALLEMTLDALRRAERDPS